MSADGKQLATLKPMNREWVRLNQISPHVINALIATEDHRFYDHYGIDLRRIASGILGALRSATRRAAPLSPSSSRAISTRKTSAAGAP